MNPVLILLLVILIDYRIGDPAALPHPIVYIGKLIAFVEKNLRKVGLEGFVGGGLLWVLVNGIVIMLITILMSLANKIHPILWTVLIIYGGFSAMAATCLAVEVRKVKEALVSNTLEDARHALSYLVGRDTAELSHEEIIKAAVETTSENTIDGILAPMFYLAIGFVIGYPLQMVFLYKTVNTLDSMVGYVNEPYKKFGYVSAKMDDLFNLIPARIGSFIMLLSGGVLGEDISTGLKVFKRDRYNHKSPNAGHPEAAIAGLLGIELGGTNTYFGEVLIKPAIGEKKRTIEVSDIETTIRIMYMSEFIFLMMLMVILMLIGGM